MATAAEELSLHLDFHEQLVGERNCLQAATAGEIGRAESPADGDRTPGPDVDRRRRGSVYVGACARRADGTKTYYNRVPHTLNHTSHEYMTSLPSSVRVPNGGYASPESSNLRSCLPTEGCEASNICYVVHGIRSSGWALALYSTL